MYKKYWALCENALNDDYVFSQFRNNTHCRGMVETVGKAEGIVLWKQIKTIYPHLISFVPKFLTSDTIGHPIVYPFGKVIAAPTTLRYVKILGDLLSKFGDLSQMNIIEIGIGYGGQSKIIHDFCTPKSYTLVDAPAAQKLAKKFLKCFGYTKNILLRSMEVITQVKYDLIISNFAFSELNRETQEFYRKNILNNSKRGYIIANIYGNGDKNQPYSKEDYVEFGKDVECSPEGLNNKNNFIYVWK